MRCWSCGAQTDGLRFMFTCPNCAQVEELRELRKQVSASMENLEEIQLRGFDVLQGRLSEVASVLEWGFEQIGWRLEQQTNVLKGIDHTLKTPSETQANEWRQIAEKLRNRGDLPKALEFFVKANDTNPLDYRTYIGAAHTYLRMGKPDSAMRMLTSSLLHAPKDYYRAYSRRLLGHVHACREDYGHARDELAKAVKLAPDYVDAHYDHAQYSALTGNRVNCLESLQMVLVNGGPRYYRLAESENNFVAFRGDVDDMLQRFYQKAWEDAQVALAGAESELARADESMTQARESLNDAPKDYREWALKGSDTGDFVALESCMREYQRATRILSTAQRGAILKDYGALVRSQKPAAECASIASEIRRKMLFVQRSANEATSRKAQEGHDRLLYIGGAGFFGGLVGGLVVGPFLSFFTENDFATIVVCLLLGALFGVISAWLE